MARIAAVMELQPTDRRRSQDARNHQGRDAPLNDDVSMEQTLGNMSATPWDEELKRIASLTDIRRGKVLNIRRQISEGTYEVGDRLDGAIDRILEAITAWSLPHSCCPHDDSNACNHVVSLFGQCG